MEFTEQQLTSLGQAYHRRERSACPSCGAQLETSESDYMNGEAHGIDIVFYCGRCDASGHFRAGSSPEPLTDAQAEALIDGYWRHRSGRCPRDRAVLRFEASQAMGAPTRVFVRCPLCGLHAETKERSTEPAS